MSSILRRGLSCPDCVQSWSGIQFRQLPDVNVDSIRLGIDKLARLDSIVFRHSRRFIVVQAEIRSSVKSHQLGKNQDLKHISVACIDRALLTMGASYLSSDSCN